jgi:hypothetical protein
MADFTELKIDGRVATPADEDWDAARLTWNLAADAQPEAVAFAEHAGDVAAVIGFASANGLKVIGQGTGHGATGVGDFGGTIMIKTERMREVSVDADAGRARIQAGVLSAEAAAATHDAGFTGLPGSSPDVSVTGFSLGGGVGWLGRKYGFACNRVVAIEAVTADGQQRRIDGDSEPDLFWALRGGGGCFAIVTAIEVDLVPVTEVFGGTVIYPAALGLDGLRAYRDWAAQAPEEVSSIVRFLTPPPLPDVPEPLRGTPLLTIGAVAVGDLDAGAEAIAPIRELGEPIMDMVDRLPTNAISRIHMDPENPVPGVGHSGLLRELPDEALEAFAGQVGPGSESPLLMAELIQLGGALGRPAEGAGALTHLDASFLMFGVGVAMSPEMAAAATGALDRLEEAMAPWAADGAFLNFADRPADLEDIFDADTASRLVSIKREWDPDGVIRANHMPSGS